MDNKKKCSGIRCPIQHGKIDVSKCSCTDTCEYYTPASNSIVPQLKINVLGVEYSITICHYTEDKRLTDMDGFCDETSKEIFVENYADTVNDLHAKRKLELQVQKTVRHELVHAFLFECGLAENSEWAQNEELVDWIAIQGPKLLKAWQEAGAL